MLTASRLDWKIVLKQNIYFSGWRVERTDSRWWPQRGLQTDGWNIALAGQIRRDYMGLSVPGTPATVVD